MKTHREECEQRAIAYCETRKCTPLFNSQLGWGQEGSEFVKGGWSIKSIHRLILKSATYRQATSHALGSKHQTIDPANRFYWRGDTRRLPAEKIRDAILSVTGQLDDRHDGPGMTPDVPCRTIFTRVMRNSSDELLESFDLPLFFSSNSSRNTTTTPVQSLLLINSDMMLSHARNLSQLALASSNEVQNQIAFAWTRVYGHQPTSSEVQRSQEFIETQTQLISRLNAKQETQFIETAKLPYRNGQAIRFVIEKPELELSIPHSPAMNVGDFTLETFFQLRSSDEGSAVRTLLGKWSGDVKKTGWGFGVTGRGSRRKPQTLVLQLVSELSDGTTGEQAIFSDQHIELNKPYYVGVSVRLSKPEARGTATFYLKDLSNDDEPLLTAVKEHGVVGGFGNELPLMIGGLKSSRPRPFDGLIDDVRFVGQALTVDQLLYSSERMVPGTVGHWQFESEPGVTRNSVEHMPDIEAKGRSIIRLKPTEAAMVDFCHSLLNSNGFLYVD